MKPSVLFLAASILISGHSAAADAPESPDASLHGIIKTDDSHRIASDREKALAILESIPADAYGRNEIPRVRKLITSEKTDIADRDLTAFRKVRSTQINDIGIFSYPFFSCHFKKKNGRLFFEKTTGSQRKSGYIYDNGPDAKVFLGGWSVNNDPQTTYDSENSVAGSVYRIAADRIIMLFISPDERSFEIYELKK